MHFVYLLRNAKLWFYINSTDVKGHSVIHFQHFPPRNLGNDLA